MPGRRQSKNGRAEAAKSWVGSVLSVRSRPHVSDDRPRQPVASAPAALLPHCRFGVKRRVAGSRVLAPLRGDDGAAEVPTRPSASVWQRRVNGAVARNEGGTRIERSTSLGGCLLDGIPSDSSLVLRARKGRSYSAWSSFNASIDASRNSNTNGGLWTPRLRSLYARVQFQPALTSRSSAKS